MKHIEHDTDSLSTRDAGWIIFILALGAGFSVASIYYAQPLLPLMAPIST